MNGTGGGLLVRGNTWELNWTTLRPVEIDEILVRSVSARAVGKPCRGSAEEIDARR